MSFRVTLQPSGHNYTIEPTERILAAAIGAGHCLPYSCRQGVCGTCKGRVLEGEVDHSDSSFAYLTAEERQKGVAMLCQARPLSDLVIEVEELEGLAGISARTMPARVAKLERVTDDVMVLELRIPMNENLRFAPGQYADFILPNGERRSFSIANSPTTAGVTELEFHLKYIEGGHFTSRVFGEMKPREILRLEGPLGTFYLRESNKSVVLIATGTGFAPIQSILSDVFRRGVHKKRDFTLYWGGPTLESLYRKEIAEQWQRDYPGFKFVPVLTAADDAWTGRRGYVQHAVHEDFPDMSDCEVYACGSPEMVRGARRLFTEEGSLHSGSFYADEFLPAASTKETA